MCCDSRFHTELIIFGKIFFAIINDYMVICVRVLSAQEKNVHSNISEEIYKGMTIKHFPSCICLLYHLYCKAALISVQK